MSNFLALLALPVLGAFVGYLTNYVAIRMLFRPLRPWRFLGLPVPMTPGVIPGKRTLLAENIGKMVGGHLLTREDVHRALSEEGFQRELQILVEERLTGLMRNELGPLPVLVPEQFRGYFDTGVKILKWRLSKHLHTFLDSEDFERHVSRLVDERLEDILAAGLDRTLDGETRARMGGTAGEAAGRLFASDWFQELVKEYLDGRFAEVIASKRTPADLLPDGILNLLLEKVEKEAPLLLAKIAGQMEEPALQERIALAIGSSLRNFISSMGPLASIVGNFLDPDLVDQKIKDYLAEHRGDFTRWQTDQDLQLKLASLLRQKIEQLFSTPLATLIGRVQPEKIAAIRKQLAAQLYALLRRPETAALIGRLLHQALERQASLPLRETLTELAGQEGLERGRKWPGRRIISMLRSAECKRILDGMMSDITDHNILARPIGSLAAFLPKAVQEGIRDYLLAQICDLLIREVPNLVDTLNVQKIVARKVNSLDLLKLEGLLLGIMQEQFKYINIFGALLGFLIGSLNLLLMLTW